MFSEFLSSKFEAYVTNTNTYKWNLNLPLIGLTAQFLTSIFILLTALVIKIFFKINKQKHKPKIQNTIKFRTLNLAYGFGLLGVTILHLTLMMSKDKDTYIVHYTVSIVFNSMLGSFLLTNGDALDYLKQKLKSWIGQQKLKQKTEVGPWMNGSVRRTIVPKIQVYRPDGENPVFMIDIEDEENL